MTRIVTTVRIARPIATVFDYVTTPANWPHWHPASRTVSAGADHPLEVGEEVVEEFVAAGRRGSVVWRVTARNAPHLWTIVAAHEEGSATLTYRLSADGDGTLFERDLAYRASRLSLLILDLLVLRWRMARESREALRRLKAVLEAAPR